MAQKKDSFHRHFEGLIVFDVGMKYESPCLQRKLHYHFELAQQYPHVFELPRISITKRTEVRNIHGQS